MCSAKVDLYSYFIRGCTSRIYTPFSLCLSLHHYANQLGNLKTKNAAWAGCLGSLELAQEETPPRAGGGQEGGTRVCAFPKTSFPSLLILLMAAFI